MKALLAAAGFSLAATASAQAATADLEFAIKRNGEQIGSYTVHTEQTGPDLTVKTASNLAVKKLMITFYHREQTSNERWANGRLVGFNSATDDNGTKHQVTVATKGAGLELQADGKTTQVDKSLVPLTMWNAGIVKQTQGFDEMDGKVMPIKVTDVGVEDTDSLGHSVKAHHYTVATEFNQDVWYDEQGHLVRVRFTVSQDGSVIEYELTSAKLEPALAAANGAAMKPAPKPPAAKPK
jgi:hypothetical protein